MKSYIICLFLILFSFNGFADIETITDGQGLENYRKLSVEEAEKTANRLLKYFGDSPSLESGINCFPTAYLVTLVLEQKNLEMYVHIDGKQPFFVAHVLDERNKAVEMTPDDKATMEVLREMAESVLPEDELWYMRREILKKQSYSAIVTNDKKDHVSELRHLETTHYTPVVNLLGEEIPVVRSKSRVCDYDWSKLRK